MNFNLTVNNYAVSRDHTRDGVPWKEKLGSHRGFEINNRRASEQTRPRRKFYGSSRWKARRAPLFHLLHWLTVNILNNFLQNI
jgi:hypothetical protein